MWICPKCGAENTFIGLTDGGLICTACDAFIDLSGPLDYEGYLEEIYDKIEQVILDYLEDDDEE